MERVRPGAVRQKSLITSASRGVLTYRTKPLPTLAHWIHAFPQLLSPDRMRRPRLFLGDLGPRPELPSFCSYRQTQTSIVRALRHLVERGERAVRRPREDRAWLAAWPA